MSSLPVSHLSAHPKNAQIYGAEVLSPAFLESVRTHGILVPLVVKPDGMIISGHRRWQAARLLGMETLPVQVVDYTDELDERKAVIEYNRQRLKTLSQQMREADELRAIEGERAEQVRLANLKRGADSPDVETLPRREPGKTRDKVAAAVGLGSGRTYAKAARIWDAAKDGDPLARTLVEKLDTGQATVHGAHRELDISQKMAKRAREDREVLARLPGLEERCQLILADIRELDLPPDSVDAIICDPPYGEDGVPLHEDLARLAAKVLKPGSPLVVLTGHVHLLECAALMRRHLRYHWIMTHLQGGPGRELLAFRVRAAWKPILIFSKGRYTGGWIVDVVKSDGPDKVHHPWGQSVSGFKQLVERFSRPGQTVLDPFLGGGTTAVAALELDRRFIGSDVNPEALVTTRRRLGLCPDSTWNCLIWSRPSEAALRHDRLAICARWH